MKKILNVDLANTLYYNYTEREKYGLVLSLDSEIEEPIRIDGNIVHGRETMGAKEKFADFRSKKHIQVNTDNENRFYFLCFNEFGYSSHYVIKTDEITSFNAAKELMSHEVNKDKFIFKEIWI